MLLKAVSSVLGVLALAPAALAAPTPDPAGTNDFGGFRNVLPPGQNGHLDAIQAAAFVTTGARPAHNQDQLPLYRDLLRARPGLTAERISEFFKPAGFGVAADQEALRYSPRDDVTIVRERRFGVPSVYGTDRRGTMFGAGYVGAEDRLFLMDVLRHAGRAQLSSFIGGSEGNREIDATQWQIAPYTEADLQRQFDQADDLYGDDGRQVQEDVREYVDGINKYICEAQPLRPDCTARQRTQVTGRNGATPAEKLPDVYSLLRPNGLPGEEPSPRLFTVTDVIATASLVGGIFGKGGGGELQSALVLEQAIRRFGADGNGVWGDFRSGDDPEAPTTTNRPFPYMGVPADPAGESDGRPDAGTTQPAEVVAGETGPEGLPGGILGGLTPRSGPRGASNALVVSAAESESGRPLSVFGPQVSYFSPQILVELDLHAPARDGRPGIDARGAAFPGVNLYVQLGRGRDYAWSATSAGQDIVDTFALDLCEPGGGTPTLSSGHYRYRGRCEPFEVLERRNQWTPNAADQSPAGTQTLRTERSRLGLVVGRAMVDGRPTAYAQLRTTYMHEADSALGFMDFNAPERMNDAADFQRAASRIGFTFNWFYADDRDIAYFNSGWNPQRNGRANPDFPVRACPTDACEFEWRGFDPERLVSDRTPAAEHPQAVNPPYLSSWNNRPAPGYRAADDNWSYTAVHRSESLDDRIVPVIEGGGRSNLLELLDAVQDAATVDVRGSEVLPTVLDVLGDQAGDAELAAAVNLLRDWSRRGAHRRDLDGDGNYDDAAAVALMDAWWPRLVAAQFRPALGQELYDAIRTVVDLDDPPGLHRGSAYIAGWYGYVDRDLRAVRAGASRRARGAGASGGLPSRRYCGGGDLATCRADLVASLREALDNDDPQTVYPDPVSACDDTNMSRQMCNDAIVHTTVGVAGQPAIPWQNRPTFQQVVEVQGHRGRGTPAATAEPARPAATPAPRRPAQDDEAPREAAPHGEAPRSPARVIVRRRTVRREGGSLPFTGLALGGMALAGAGLLGVGLDLRRRLRRGERTEGGP